jgi:general secretion pathway protein I
MASPRQRGFSLLEVLVAFSVLALSLGLLLRIFGGNGRLAGLADEHARAVVLAQSLLSQAGVEAPLRPGQLGGTDAPFDWTLRVSPFMPPGEPLPEMPFKPYWVEAIVEWGEGDGRRVFSLGTLRLVGENRPQNPLAPGGGIGRR